MQKGRRTKSRHGKKGRFHWPLLLVGAVVLISIPKAWQMGSEWIAVQNAIREASAVEEPAEDFRPDTAFIACNDRAAVRLIDTARAAGYEPGRDYKLISFDDDRRFADYRLTTLSPNLELIAQLLAEELIAAIDGRHPDFTSTHRIISKVIRRDTM